MKKIIYSLATLLFLGIIAGYFWYFPIKFKPEILHFSHKYSLSPNLIYAIIKAESNFNADAISRVGACGLMQVMPSTAEFMIERTDLDIKIEDIFVPSVNIEIGCAYLRYLLDKFDNLDGAICAYNAGETTVKNWQKGNKGIPYKETRRYLFKVKMNITFYQKRILASV